MRLLPRRGEGGGGGLLLFPFFLETRARPEFFRLTGVTERSQIPRFADVSHCRSCVKAIKYVRRLVCSLPVSVLSGDFLQWELTRHSNTIL